MGLKVVKLPGTTSGRLADGKGVWGHSRPENRLAGVMYLAFSWNSLSYM